MEERRRRRILRWEYVKPKHPTPTHPIWLSNLDLTPNVNMFSPLIYLYNHLPDIAKLKLSLSKALVPFYPFAGELRHDHHGRNQVLCTAKGVLFVEASCDGSVADFTPGPTLLSLFFSEAVHSVDPPCSLTLVQVTKFPCGSTCLGVAIHHNLVDGVSASLFLDSWAQIARGAEPNSIPRPLLDRTLLKARSPPSVQYDHTEYDFISPTEATVPEPTLTSVLCLTREQAAMLKAAGNKMGMSIYSIIIAHAWRSACKAKKLPLDKTTKLYVVSDVRNRMEPPISKNFLGNVIVTNKLEADVGEVISGTIYEVGRKVEHIKTRLHDGYLRSLIDFLQVNEPTMKELRPLPVADFVAVSWLSMGGNTLDFGWGVPVYMNRATVGANVIYVKHDAAKEEKIMVSATLEEEHIAEYEKIFFHDLHISLSSRL